MMNASHRRTTWSSVGAAGLLFAIAATTFRAEATVTYSDPWELGINGPNGTWSWVEKEGAWSLQRIAKSSEPQNVRKGDYGLRVEVRPGDFTDYGGERAEVAHMKSAGGSEIVETSASGTKFYAVSVKVPTTWTPPTGSNPWAIVLQLHGPTGYASPSFALNLHDRFNITGQVGDHGGSSEYFTYELSESSLNKGKWVDFVVKIKWATGPTGTMQIWRRDEGETAFAEVLNKSNIKTLAHMGESTPAQHYWKHGLYRSPSSVTHVVYLDGLTRGDTFDEVVAAAFPSDQQAPPQDPVSLADASNIVATSGNLVADHTADNLFDDCLTDAAGCTAGTNASKSFYVELDLGKQADLTEARLHGDANGTWVSNSWTVQTKLLSGDAWTTASPASSALGNQWYSKALTNVRARFVRVTVNGNPNSSTVQARELEILGVPVLQPNEVTMQAEDGTITAPMVVSADAAAVGGELVTTPVATAHSTSTPGAGRAVYSFTIASGNYNVWAKVKAPSASADSFWVRMDGGTWVPWNGLPLGGLQWDQVHDTNAGGQIVNYSLSAGQHTLEIAHRESNVGLDMLVVQPASGPAPAYAQAEDVSDAPEIDPEEYDGAEGDPVDADPGVEDGEPQERGAEGGGCSAAGARTGDAGFAAVLAALTLAMLRRRRSGTRKSS